MENKKKALIIEDDVFVISIYQTKLEHEGFEVEVAGNGLEALKKMEKFLPDLILLDILMPYLDGIGTLRELKKNENWQKIPVIMLTNLSEKDKVEEALSLGADDYLIKSHFTPSEVIVKIRAVIDAKQAKEQQ